MAMIRATRMAAMAMIVILHPPERDGFVPWVIGATECPLGAAGNSSVSGNSSDLVFSLFGFLLPLEKPFKAYYPYHLLSVVTVYIRR